MSAQGLYEDRLEDALRDLLHWHRHANRLAKQDALRKLNKTVSDKIEEIQGEEMNPTQDDAERYCPMNSKCRGDNQTALCVDDRLNEGTCKLDNERCQYSTCSTLKKLMEYSGDIP